MKKLGVLIDGGYGWNLIGIGGGLGFSVEIRV